MTRKEARKIIEIIDKVYCTLDKEERQALAVAIHALEQGSIIDKIRAEIKGMYRVVLKDAPEDDWAVKWNECVDEVLQIIDKYKAESEAKN